MLQSLYVAVQYPGYRLEWIRDKAVLVCPDGSQFLIPDRRKKRKRWSWKTLAMWLIPRIIAIGSIALVLMVCAALEAL